MKQFPIFILIVFLIGLSSCKKDDNATNDPFPEWLQTKITEIVTDKNICSITDVTLIEYKEKRYYNVYCGLWSCVYCQFFDENGNRPNWETTDWNDFFANKKEIKVVPACQ